ncbi:MAG: hypothetical protein EPO68_07650 [Planctomycetota bacterium]|nr:MAG: hypothetical protein EPO68_07650 [Planctomycetota bacterium]
MRSTRCRKLTLPFCAVLVSSGAAAQCLDKILPADPHDGAAFGISVALHANRAIVGALGHGVPNPAGGPAPNADGAAYLFERGPNGWVQTAQLFADPTSCVANFGASVAIHGDLAFVGSPLDSTHGLNSGAVHVYERTASGWQSVAKLEGSDASTEDQFGYAVAFDGQRLAVAARWANGYTQAGTPTSSPRGAAYVFEHTGGAWVQTAELQATQLVGAEQYAYAIALSGDWLAVGAPLTNGATRSAGAVYLYRRNGGAWVYDSKLTPTGSSYGDYFGKSVALEGTRLLVGATLDDEIQGNAGAAYVFEFGPNGWTQTAKLHGAGVITQEQFGWSVALDGEHALIGDNDFQDFNGGAAHLFEHRTEGWFELARLQPDYSYTSVFSRAVALSDGTALVGSRYDDTQAHSGGAVYSFGVPTANSVQASTQQISAATGGSQVLQIDAGCTFAGRVYLTLGSLGGYAPGLDMKPLIVPLNPDAYFFLTLQAPNHAPLSSSLGVLDAQGRGATTISIAPGSVANLVGLTGWHAFGVVLFDPYAFVAFASAPQRLDIAP